VTLDAEFAEFIARQKRAARRRLKWLILAAAAPALLIPALLLAIGMVDSIEHPFALPLMFLCAIGACVYYVHALGRMRTLLPAVRVEVRSNLQAGLLTSALSADWATAVPHLFGPRRHAGGTLLVYARSDPSQRPLPHVRCTALADYYPECCDDLALATPQAERLYRVCPDLWRGYGREELFRDLLQCIVVLELAQLLETQP